MIGTELVHPMKFVSATTSEDGRVTCLIFTLVCLINVLSFGFRICHDGDVWKDFQSPIKLESADCSYFIVVVLEQKTRNTSILRECDYHSFGGWVILALICHWVSLDYGESGPEKLFKSANSPKLSETNPNIPYRDSATAHERQAGVFVHLVRRKQRRRDQLDTLSSSNDWCIVNLTVSSNFQQKVSEPPDIVQEDREHEVEQPNAVILRRSLR
ncbi:hypothetical protein SAMN04488691_11724 [Haloferax larsenii]|uniref:Uncharacterized protein n=1 Tax=Haloferax larsenii TaxID=302484 RepID=A0A1H7V7A1_HALLR|nr:hypothetical protein SAMN04488691_11724 [Haloferax larsenii]